MKNPAIKLYLLHKRANVLHVDFRARRRAHHDPPAHPAPVVAIRPPVRRAAREAAMQLFARATVLDESPHTLREAEFLYREAVRLVPTYTTAIVNLANVVLKREVGGAARARLNARRLYEHAVRLEAWHPEAWFNLGWIAFEERRWPAAWHAYERVLASPEAPDDLRRDAEKHARFAKSKTETTRRRP